MSTETAPKRRRIGPSNARQHTVRVQFRADERERLDTLSDRYGVAVGTIAHEACVAGLGAVVERMRRAADRRLVDDLLHAVGGSRQKATGHAVVLADEARKTATECEADGDHPGAAEQRANAERLDRAGAIRPGGAVLQAVTRRPLLTAPR